MTFQPHARRIQRQLLLCATGLLVSFSAALAGPALAEAGTYTISATCDAWRPFSQRPELIYAGGCTAYSQTVTATTPYMVGGGLTLTAPGGTRIVGLSTLVRVIGTEGWNAWFGSNNGLLISCPSSACPPGPGGYYGPLNSSLNTTQVLAAVRCDATTGCRGIGTSWGQVQLESDASSVTIHDPTRPSAALVGGGLATAGWKRGPQRVVVAGHDNTGIFSTTALIDGRQRDGHSGRGCRFSQQSSLVPCPNGADTLTVDTRTLADGRHTLVGRAIDPAGNAASTSARAVYVDNTAPVSPQRAGLVGGAGWRSTNSFAIRWATPAMTNAAVIAAVVELCPSRNRPGDGRGCVRTSRNRGRQRTFGAASGLGVPGEGSYRARLWLVDAAGNQNPDSAATITGLGFDRSPPRVSGFLDQDPQNPTLIRVQAGDAVSGVVRGEIEARRQGTEAWQPLPTRVTSGGLQASLDDEALPKGVYDLRARAFDRAGLDGQSDRRRRGGTASVTLPLRLTTRLAAGRPGAKRCRRVNARRHGTHRRGSRRVCRRPLIREPQLAYGRAARLHGRVWARGNQPVQGAAVEVWRQLRLPGAGWQRLETVTTSRTGGFSYRAPKGPARRLRFRYPGTATVRPSRGDVDLRVKAATTIRASRRVVINGETVTFRGRVKGGFIPAGGTLVELQVRTRGQWRTFAQPRARQTNGRWAYRYRFETIKGRARFRFRARIRRQPDYPFATGTSRVTEVRVRGL